MLDEGTPFFGVNTAASDTISAPQVPLGKRAIIFGDSLTTPIISEPTLPPIQPGGAGSGYPQDLGEYFNWDWWESGVSGSGFTVGGVDNLTFVQRALTDICGRNPDLIVLFGGLNDYSSTEQSTQEGATDFLSEVNACLPGTPIYLLGPQAPSTSVATAMAAAAALFPTTVDFGGTAPQFWVYGDRSDPTTGNAYLYLGDLNDNAGHPTPLGHDFLAEEVAASIMGLSPSLAPQPFNLFAPAPAIGSFGYSEATNAVLGAGDHQISITFTPADAVNYAVVTQPVLLTVNRASSSLALSNAPASAAYGRQFTVAASATSGLTVSFTSSGVCTNSGATYTMTSGTGRCSVIANQAGDSNYAAAPQVTERVTATPASTTTVLTTTPNPSVAGQAVTFTATVTATSGGFPSGTVSFKHLGTLLGTATLSNGVASFATSLLSVGTDHITALYSGSATNAESTSAAVAQVVNRAPTTTILASSLNPSAVGQSVIFTATVTAPSGGFPSGTVSFKHLGTLLGTAALSNGVASFTTSTLPAGTDHIVGVYSGSPTNTGSSSAALAQIVH